MRHTTRERAYEKFPTKLASWMRKRNNSSIYVCVSVHFVSKLKAEKEKKKQQKYKNGNSSNSDTYVRQKRFLNRILHSLSFT